MFVTMFVTMFVVLLTRQRCFHFCCQVCQAGVLNDRSMNILTAEVCDTTML